MTRPPIPDGRHVGLTHPIQVNYDPAWSDMPMTHLDALATFLGGSGTSFTGLLLQLMCKADLGNRMRLASVYPWHDIGLTIWEGLEVPTYGAMWQTWRKTLETLEVMRCETHLDAGSGGESTSG